MKTKLLMLLCVICLPFLSEGSEFIENKKDTEKVEKKKDTEYAKLFKGKKVETKKGLLTLHKVDQEKLYFELPLNLLGKDMLLGSTVSEISNNQHAVIGQKTHFPLRVFFSKMGNQIQLRKCFVPYMTDNIKIQTAIDKSSIGAIMKSFKIEAYSPDSTAVVFDITEFFTEQREDMQPFDPYGPMGRKPYQRTFSFDKKNCFLGDIKSFPDNVVVKSYLSYKVDVLYKNGKDQGYIEKKNPFTALMTRTLILLPEEEMRVRYADPRINIFYVARGEFSDDRKSGSKPIYFARRWRLEPKDEAAHKRGELVEPKKPIVFYIDSAFPEKWKKPIKQGVEQWNLAFEKIGFKNAIKAIDFPENDPEFDPDNIKYSCVRYAPIGIKNAMGPSWFDPRTGEVLTASVYLYHDIMKLITEWRFIHTSPADSRVRTTNLPDDIMEDALRYVVTHEVGHCLSLMHNMAASEAIPVDSLRSPAYTQKYGTTMSVMDYARFNYVAQPGDKERGVKLTPPNLGKYDYFSIKWLYSPIYNAENAKGEIPILDKWISEKSGDPVYRYGKQQIGNLIDPSSVSEDLGNDKVKASEYGVKNLKYIMKNLNKWVGDEDKDFSFRTSIYKGILRQYQTYLFHVYGVLGGIYLNERYAGDALPSYEFVSREYQKRALKFLADQLNDVDWLDDETLLKEMPLQGCYSVKFQNIILMFMMANRAALSDMPNRAKDAYTPEEHFRDGFNYIWKNTIKGKDLTAGERTIQNRYLENMFLGARIDTQTKKSDKSIAVNSEENIFYDNINYFKPLLQKDRLNANVGNIVDEYESFFNFMDNNQSVEEYQGFGYLRGLSASSCTNYHIFYGLIIDAKKLLEKRQNTGSEETRLHYKMLLQKINRML